MKLVSKMTNANEAEGIAVFGLQLLDWHSPEQRNAQLPLSRIRTRINSLVKLLLVQE